MMKITVELEIEEIPLLCGDCYYLDKRQSLFDVCMLNMCEIEDKHKRLEDCPLKGE